MNNLGSSEISNPGSLPPLTFYSCQLQSNSGFGGNDGFSGNDGFGNDGFMVCGVIVLVSSLTLQARPKIEIFESKPFVLCPAPFVLHWYRPSLRVLLPTLSWMTLAC